MSQDAYDPVVSHEVKGLAFGFSLHMGDFSTLVSDLEADPEGWFFSDDPQAPAPTDLLEKAVINMITDDFTVVPSTKKQGDVSRAMSMAIKTCLNEVCAKLPSTPRVLLIGAGYGNDVRRVLRAMSRAGKPGASFTCVEPSALRLHKCITENSGVYPILGEFNNVYPSLRTHPPFDLIVCTMSLQYVVGKRNPLVVAMSDLLNPTGKIVGTYFDHDSYYTSMLPIMREIGSSILVSPRSYDDTTVLGVHATRIYGTSFVDPYVNPCLVHDFAQRHCLSYELYRGVSALKRYGTSTLMRAVKSTSLTSSLVTLVVFGVPDRLVVHLPPVIKDREVDTEAFFGKARALSNKEIIHYRPGQYAVGIKRDGLRQYWTLDSRGLIGYRPDPLLIPAPMVPVVMQIEKTEDGTHYLVDAYCIDWVPGRVPFLRRQALCAEIIIFLEPYVKIFQNEFFVPMCESDIFWLQLKSMSTEGIIIVTLAPHFMEPFSDIRYSKPEFTVDVIDPDYKGLPPRIIETWVSTGEKVRDRPDKNFPNPDHVIKEIKSAPKLSEVWNYLLASADMTPLSDSELEVISSFDFNMSKWEPSQIMNLLYRRSVFPFPVLKVVSNTVIEAFDNAAFSHYKNERAVEAVAPPTFTQLPTGASYF